MSAPDGRSWVLGSDAHRRLISSFIVDAPPGWVARLEPPTRTYLQNRFLHALLSDIADQLPWPRETEELHDMEWWKRRCTLQWLIDNKQPVEVITPLQRSDNEEDFGLLLPHTSDLTTPEFSSLTEWIISFGTLNGVTFSNPKWPT
jgi:hypothetical protein